MIKYRLYVSSGKRGIENHLDIEEGSEGSLIVGRDGEACSMVVDNGQVSRMHLKIAWNGTGRFYVEDLLSTNGTFVNGSAERLVGQMEFKVSDKINMGAPFLNLTCTLVRRDEEAEKSHTQPMPIVSS
jgi:predicted component of type VI protein secretion system